MPKLTIIAGENSGTSYSFDVETTLGRSTEASITLQDLRASRKHARVVRIEHDFYVEDLQSQNGTFLNGQKVKQRCKLVDKDNIRIGNTYLSFSLKDDAIGTGAYFCGYQIAQKLIEDATGTIFLAEQKSLQRNVLLWVFPLSRHDAGSLTPAHQTFIEQISQISNFFHPNLLMVLDFDITEQHCFCAFEQANIEANLRSCVKNHPLPMPKILEIALQVASGLQYAHNHNMLHLHLTSKNILIQPDAQDRVIITELGVAKFLSSATIGSGLGGHLTKTTGILGVSEYIAPEQIHGETLPGVGTDIYSFGCLLYHLLTGNPPFVADKPSDLAQMHLDHNPVPILDYRPDAHPDLVKLVERCLEKNIIDRYSSFQEITIALQEIQKQIQLQQSIASQKTDSAATTLIRWWILGPIMAALLGALTFFATPGLLEILQLLK